MNWYPAFIHSYDLARREIEVTMPQVVGGEVPLIAELAYPLGDDSRYTDIHLEPGMPVWVVLIGGDPRYPLVVANRTVRKDNDLTTRRQRHENFEFNAVKRFDVNADTAEVQAVKTVTIQAGEAITLLVGGTKLELTAAQIEQVAELVKIIGQVDQSGGDVSIADNLAVGGNATVGGNAAVTGNVQAAAVAAATMAAAGSLSVAGTEVGGHDHVSAAPGYPVGPMQ